MPGSISFIRTSWRFLGDARLSVCLIYAIFADILAGSVIMRHHPVLFLALKDLTLQQWMASYGIKSLHTTWWFFLALFLLFLLALTTLACGADKAIAIIARFHRSGIWTCIWRLSPSIIHLGFLMLLLGQLASHTLGVNSHGNILAVRGTTVVPGSGISISLKHLDIAFFGKGTRLPGMEGMPRDCSGTLSIADSKGVHEKRISINRPVWYRGWSFFIEDFGPRTKGAKRPPFINMIIRKDPGIRLMVAGAIVFGLGLVMYLPLAMRIHANCQVQNLL